MRMRMRMRLKVKAEADEVSVQSSSSSIQPSVSESVQALSFWINQPPVSVSVSVLGVFS